jgi:hypothetical protein
MAVNLAIQDVARLISVELAPMVRYRSLVIQSSDMLELSSLAESVFEASHSLGSEPRVFEYSEFFDDVGAVSCDETCERIGKVAQTQPVILAGPLHFLDFWSEATRDVFWRTLASFSSGPGIVVVDTPRNEGIEGPFRLIGRLNDTDIRVLKSRLSVTQDRVA